MIPENMKAVATQAPSYKKELALPIRDVGIIYKFITDHYTFISSELMKVETNQSVYVSFEHLIAECDTKLRTLMSVGDAQNALLMSYDKQELSTEIEHFLRQVTAATTCLVSGMFIRYWETLAQNNGIDVNTNRIYQKLRALVHMKRDILDQVTFNKYLSVGYAHVCNLLESTDQAKKWEEIITDPATSNRIIALALGIVSNDQNMSVFSWAKRSVLYTFGSHVLAEILQEIQSEKAIETANRSSQRQRTLRDLIKEDQAQMPIDVAVPDPIQPNEGFALEKIVGSLRNELIEAQSKQVKVFDDLAKLIGNR